jgi:predicted aspartyl protease
VNPRLVSARYPYLLIRVQFGPQVQEVDALLDTGFDGPVSLPPHLIPPNRQPNYYIDGVLADGSVVRAPIYRRSVTLGSLGTFAALVLALGDEPLVGRGLIDRFTTTLDHGRQIIIEP